MDLLKIVGEIIKARDEIGELADKIKYQERTIDKMLGELIEVFKHKGLIETRRVK